MLVNNVGGVRVRTEGFLAISDEEFEASMQLKGSSFVIDGGLIKTT
jgi:hypothetical protein